jgi:hypothetical protein
MLILLHSSSNICRMVKFKETDASGDASGFERYKRTCMCVVMATSRSLGSA